MQFLPIEVYWRLTSTHNGSGIPLSMIVLFAVGRVPITPWATTSSLRFTIGSQKFDGNSTARLAFIANSPQLLLSIVYL
jgi:hypothetical protein